MHWFAKVWPTSLKCWKQAGSRGDHFTRLAEALALDGKIDDALITIEEALQANPEELAFQSHQC